MNDRFLRACRREPVDVTPVWFMRQAGRYMPQYRALRERYGLLDICRSPELAVEVTLQPVEEIEVDAAIIANSLASLECWGQHAPQGGPPPPHAARLAAHSPKTKGLAGVRPWVSAILPRPGIAKSASGARLSAGADRR